MSDTTDLHAQLAQRLFGWDWDPHLRLWLDPAHYLWTEDDVPAYTTDPAATAQVWQWVETREMLSIAFSYPHRLYAPVLCQISTAAHGTVTGDGTTWPEALCRAALALAEALEKEETT
jgi:hypothetical protein